MYLDGTFVVSLLFGAMVGLCGIIVLHGPA